MNTGPYASAGVTVVCILLLVVTSTTLGATVPTQPAEAIDLDYESLPVEGEDVAELNRQLDRTQPSPADDQPQSSAEVDGDQASEQEPKASQTGAQRSVEDATVQVTKHTPAEPGVVDRLLAFLQSLFAMLLSVVPLVVGLAALGVVARYRHTLYDRVRSSGDPPADDERVSRGSPDPANDIEAAWYEMIAALDLAHRDELTPRELRAQARGIGDSESVATLTRLFEEVTYGGAPVTDARRRQARDCVRSVRDDTEGGAS